MQHVKDLSDKDNNRRHTEAHLEPCQTSIELLEPCQTSIELTLGV